jgi:Domain of unknown function (DUF1843)
MPAKKAAKVSAKKAVKVGAIPPYGLPIYQSIKRGNVAEMKKQAAAARKWVSGIQTALDVLDKSIAKKG